MLSLVLIAALVINVRTERCRGGNPRFDTSSGESECEFNRNGSLHSAEAAAEHLELKYSRGKRYADSAEAFIERLASKSSWSGKPYQMICDGETQPAGDWLTATLVALRDQ